MSGTILTALSLDYPDIRRRAMQTLFESVEAWCEAPSSSTGNDGSSPLGTAETWAARLAPNLNLATE